MAGNGMRGGERAKEGERKKRLGLSLTRS